MGTIAAHEYACAEKAFDTCKEMGHRGISIAHDCFDRAKMSAMVDFLQARHELWAGRHRQAGEGPIQPASDWLVGTGCALHDASKALQCALDPWVDDKQMLKDLHIVIESPRNSYDMLEKYMPQFLMKYMTRVDTAYNKEEVAQWWRCLGARADWVETLTDINPWFHMGQLRVSSTANGQPVSADQVADCLLHIFKLVGFCETRWLTVGKSLRGLVGSLSVGLYELAKLALDLKGSIDTKLHGIKKITDSIKWYAAVGCITTFVPEAFAAVVAEDDRVCRRLPELEQAVQEELDFVFGISDFVWRRLALVAKSALWATELKTACCHAAHVTVAFLAHRVFSTVRSLPWSLCLDDIDANLTALVADKETVTDPTSIKIIRLLELGPYCTM